MENFNFKNPPTILQHNNLYICPGCLKTLTPHISHAHHVIPIGDGGSNSIRNRVLICNICHFKLHNETDEEDNITKYRVFNYMVSIHGLLVEWLDIKVFFEKEYPALSIEGSLLGNARNLHHYLKWSSKQAWADSFPTA